MIGDNLLIMNAKQIYKNRTIYIEDQIRIEYKRGKIFCINNLTDQRLLQYDFGSTAFEKLVCSIPILERLFRLEPRHAVRWTKSEFLISLRGHLYKIDVASGVVEKVFSYAKGTNNPLHFCQYVRNGIQEMAFGDYNGHDENGCVGIYRYSNKGLDKIAAFVKNQVDHIHRVEFDQHRDCYWIFTGDKNSASGIWHMDYDGGAINPFLVGDQKYRACVAFIENEKILFATDTPFEQNHICSIDIAHKHIDTLCAIPGPCIYGTIVPNGETSIYCISTSVEPDNSLPKYIYRVTYKLGAGVTDRYSYVLTGNAEEGFHKIWKTRKDILPMGLFQFGNHRFPSQTVNGKLFFCPQSCKGKGGTYVIDFSEKNDRVPEER